MQETEKKPKRWYYRWIYGATFGIEFMTEEDGGAAFLISLGILRLLRTSDAVLDEPAE